MRFYLLIFYFYRVTAFLLLVGKSVCFLQGKSRSYKLEITGLFFMEDHLEETNFAVDTLGKIYVLLGRL